MTLSLPVALPWLEGEDGLEPGTVREPAPENWVAKCLRSVLLVEGCWQVAAALLLARLPLGSPN